MKEVNAELWEIDENLCRAELSPSERAELTARRKKIYNALHNVNGRGGDRKSKSQLDSRKDASFVEETSKRTGRSEPSTYRDVSRGENVSAEALALVRGTEFDTGAFLDKLKRQPTSEQVAYVESAKENAKAAKEIDDAVEARDVDDFAARLTEWLSIEQQEYVASALDRLPAKKVARAMRRVVSA